MPLVLLRIPSLLQRSQHQVGQDPLLRFARDPAHEALVHLRCHRDALRHLVSLRGTAIAAARRASLCLPTIGLHGQLRHRQRADTQRLPKCRGGFLKVDNALRIRHLVDAINGRDPLCGKPRRNALIGAQHELFNQPVRPPTLRTHDGLHVAVRVKLHHRLR